MFRYPIRSEKKYVKRSRGCIAGYLVELWKTALSLELQVDPDILWVNREGNNKTKNTRCKYLNKELCEGSNDLSSLPCFPLVCKITYIVDYLVSI